MVMASGRWLGARLDLLASLLIASVAVAAVVVSQDAGMYQLIACVKGQRMMTSLSGLKRRARSLYNDYTSPLITLQVLQQEQSVNTLYLFIEKPLYSIRRFDAASIILKNNKV